MDTFSSGMFQVPKIDPFDNQPYTLILHVNYRTRCYVDINGTRYKIRLVRELGIECEYILYDIRWMGKQMLFARDLTPRF